MPDLKSMKLSNEEMKTLKENKPSYRYKWIIDRWGSGPEKKEYRLSGTKPDWAKQFYNQLNWEVK